MKYTVLLLALVATVSAQYNNGGYNPYKPPVLKPLKPYTPSPIRYQPPVKITPYVPTTPAPARLPVSVDYRYGPEAVVLKSGNDISPDGTYNYFYETSNGIAAQEQGTPRVFSGNPPVAPVVAQGSFSWTAPEGKLIAITYVADENGYQPSGDALPTVPPLPAQIARALQYVSKSGVKK